jgi:CRP-like cAMP-binding protein
MIHTPGSAFQLFATRLTSRSILTEAERSAVIGLNGEIVGVAAHKDFIEQGEQVDHCHLVIEGLVGRFGQSKDGARQTTCLYIMGDMTDLPSVVSPKAAWGLAALTRTTILRVAHIDLQRIAAQHPGVAEAFWRDCVADGSIFSEWVVNVGRRDALARIAHLLCEMGMRSERAGLGNRSAFPLPITQSDLGDASGLTSIHVNRTLKHLRTRIGVMIKSGKVTVPNWNALVSTGDFDDGFMLLDGPSPRILQAA